MELQFKHEVELKWNAIQIHAFLNRKGKFANTNLNVDLTKKVLKKLKSSGWMDGWIIFLNQYKCDTFDMKK